MLKKILKIFITLVAITCVYANTNDSTLIKNRYENVYAVYDGEDRVHLFYAQRYTLNDITAYCIEPGLAIDTNVYSSTEDWSITNLDNEEKNYIRLVAYYGYDYPGHNNMKYYLATQELIWRKITGREVYWVEGDSVDSPRIDIEDEKNEIINLANNHTKKPSFDNQTIEVSLGTTTIIDENDILSDYEIYSSDIDDVIIEENKLKITINSYLENAEIRLVKKHYTNSVALIYYSGNNQKMIRSGILDPVVASSQINITLKAKVKVTKVDKTDNSIIHKEGIKFKIKNVDTGEYICENNTCIFETNSSGFFITKELEQGNYQIEELEYEVFYGYAWNKIPLPFSINEDSEIIYENNEPLIEIIFPNQKVKAHVRVYKVGEKAIIKNEAITYSTIPLTGVVYMLYANENIYTLEGDILYSAGEEITNIDINNGMGEANNLPTGRYCIKEVTTPNGYILTQEPFCFKIEYRKQFTPEFIVTINQTNNLAKGSLVLTKKSSLNDLPLASVYINIYTENSELIYQGVTNDDGQITISSIPAGKYYYQEIKTIEGYLLDTQKHYFEIKENEEIVNEELINNPITGTCEVTISSFSFISK